MADRPVIFSGPMVLALLAGRKTQTRRVLNPQPHPDFVSATIADDPDFSLCPASLAFTPTHKVLTALPRPGHSLWVREALQVDWMKNLLTGERDTNAAVAYYQADDLEVLDPTGYNMAWIWERGTLPSIFMPRAFSRLTLDVVKVRVQRLHDITEEDAIAEGVVGHAGVDGGVYTAAYEVYAELWDSLNAKRGYGWDANPWVVAVTFTVHHQNIDAPRAQGAA